MQYGCQAIRIFYGDSAFTLGVYHAQIPQAAAWDLHTATSRAVSAHFSGLFFSCDLECVFPPNLHPIHTAERQQRREDNK